jgi:hypothetical protein
VALSFQLTINNSKEIISMKTALLTLFAFALFPIAAVAQSYDLSWFTIDGGGNVSVGGTYSVTGTIGQPDAGTLSGGSYSLIGGFWGFTGNSSTPIIVPILDIGLSLPNVILSWPAPSTGFVLEQSPGLGSPVWTVVGATVFVVGDRNTVTLPASATTRLFRLHASF